MGGDTKSKATARTVYDRSTGMPIPKGKVIERKFKFGNRAGRHSISKVRFPAEANVRIKKKILQQEQKMGELARYATPAAYDAKKAEAYYKAKNERDELWERYNKILDEEAAKRPKPKPAPHTFVNGFGEATTREITTAAYRRSQKRQDRAVLRNMGLY